MILNDQILGEQTYLIADNANVTDTSRPGTAPGDKSTNPDTNPDTNPSRIIGNNRSMQALSFFAFDPQRDTYTAVFMSDRDGEIHYRSGQYDVSGRKIVFEDQRSILDRTPNRITPGNRDRDLDKDRTPGIDKDRGIDEDNSGGFERQPATTPNRELRGNANPFGDDIRVVVEILSDDQHRVTMYKGDILGTENPTIRPTTTPGQDNPRTNPTQTPGREFGANEPLPANVVYQATYTRSNEQEVSEFRDLLRKADEDKGTDNHLNNQEYKKP